MSEIFDIVDGPGEPACFLDGDGESGEESDEASLHSEVTVPERTPQCDAALDQDPILTLQGRFSAQSKEGFRPLLFCLTEDFDDALALFRIRSRAVGRGYDIYQGWVERMRQAQELTDEELNEERKRGRRRKRRRRRRKPQA